MLGVQIALAFAAKTNLAARPQFPSFGTFVTISIYHAQMRVISVLYRKLLRKERKVQLSYEINNNKSRNHNAVVFIRRDASSTQQQRNQIYLETMYISIKFLIYAQHWHNHPKINIFLIHASL